MNDKPEKKRLKYGGRKPGGLNKVTLEIRAMAQEFGPEALETLVAVMRGSENDNARISATKEILDRAYGKSPQGIEVSGSGGAALVVEIVRFGAAG